MQEKFTDLEKAKTRVKEVISSGVELKDSGLCIIQDLKTGEYYVEDGCPMIRNFEKIIWEL